ncbi:MAG: CDP-glycerol glycerophosphotransferase family protein [Lachnospiraceae bacterium]|nr:CDP-glycerol glycerophosphotransferase family protein [Lachnospiraceae bacterium]
MIKYVCKQFIKMFTQQILLPVVYNRYRHTQINTNKIIFADAHHDSLPYSMEDVKNRLEQEGYEICLMCTDYQGHGALHVMRAMLSFMKHYATAKGVFICDNFLPVASCNKRPETKVVQLWHAGGILKKYAYDTNDDIPAYYKGNVFKNYDYLPVSAPICIPVYNRAMRQPEGVVHATGLSRTDRFFKESYLEGCKKEFYAAYPDAKGKKIVLFAPTFRGKASNPYVIGLDKIKQLEQELGDEWKVLIKVHPHMDAKTPTSNCTIPTERLLPVADVLIADYSSVIFDYVLLEKPMVLYAPDLEEYVKERGLYISYDEIPGRIVKEVDNLKDAVLEEYQNPPAQKLKDFKDKYMGSCDGNATERLLKELDFIK